MTCSLRALRALRAFALSFGLASVFVAAPAAAQVHWDVGADVGVMKRFLSTGANTSSNAPDAGLGPVGELHLHFALLPLVRVGAYLSHDISPQGGVPARQITSGGLHLKLASPWPNGRWRGWAFAGLGYAAVYAKSYHGVLPNQNPDGSNADIFVEGSNGSFVEVPLGVGIAYKLKKPLELTAVLGSRLGFGFAGDVYNSSVAHSPFSPPLEVTAAGNDSFALYLAVGVSFEL